MLIIFPHSRELRPGRRTSGKPLCPVRSPLGEIAMQPSGMESVYDLEKLYGEAQNGGLKFLGQQSMIINCPKNMVGR